MRKWLLIEIDSSMMKGKISQTLMSVVSCVSKDQRLLDVTSIMRKLIKSRGTRTAISIQETSCTVTESLRSGTLLTARKYVFSFPNLLAELTLSRS